MFVWMILLIEELQQKLNNYSMLGMPNLLEIDHFSQAIDPKKTKDNVPCSIGTNVMYTVQ
jgi:hypothetical protein